MDFKDVIQEKTLDDGFVLFQTDVGFFIGVRIDGKVDYIQTIDKTAFNCILRREGRDK